MCPLLREECVREKCAWWFEAGYEYESGDEFADEFADEYDDEYESGKYSQCVLTSLASLPDLLSNVVSGLEDVKSEVQRVDYTITAFGGV